MFQYYLNSFLKFIKYTTQEVYVRWFYLSSSDMQQIIKASYHLERLIFFRCDIRWFEALDFSSYSESNIKYLSFDSWGYGKRCSDFMSNPPCFENIVKAIANWNIKFSLEKLNITWCNLSIAKVQKMLIKHGINKAEVVDEEIDPASD